MAKINIDRIIILRFYDLAHKTSKMRVEKMFSVASDDSDAKFMCKMEYIYIIGVLLSV